MAAGSIVIDLLMKTGSFETDTKRAEKALKNFQKSASEFGSAVAMATTAAAAAFGLMIKASIDNMDRMNEMSQMAGVTVESLSALGYAAKTAGVNQEDLTSSLVKLSKGLSEASQGSGDALKAFEALSIDSSKFTAADDALLSIAEKFAGLEDGANKTALSLALFGKSGAQLIPFLNAGRDGIEELKDEAAKLGVVIGTDAAKAADEFNDNVDKLKANFQGLVNLIAKDLLPALNQFVIGLNTIRETSAKGWFLSSAKEEKNAQETIDVLEENLAKIKTTQKAHMDWQAANPFIAWYMADDVAIIDVQINAIVAKIDYLKSVMKSVPQAAINWDVDTYGEVAVKKKTAPGMKGEPKAAKESEFDKAMQNMREQIALIGKTTEAEKVLEYIQLDRYGKLTEAQKITLTMTAETLDSVKKSNEEWEVYSKFLDEITGKSEFDDFVKKMEMLERALYEGSISAEIYQKEVNKLSYGFKQTTDEMGEFAKEAARNIQDTLGNSMEEVLTGNFSNIGNAFTTMLNRMISQLAASQLNSLLFGKLDKTGELGGLLGTGVKAITGMFTGGTNDALGGDYGQFFSEGGYTGDGGTQEAAGIVHKGEYVLNAKATQRIGIAKLNSLNGYANGGFVGAPLPDQGGQPAVTINLVNQSKQPLQAQQSAPRFDGKKFVQDIILADLRQNGQIAQAIRG